MYKSAMYLQINAQPAIRIAAPVLLFYFMYLYFIWTKKESHGHSHGGPYVVSLLKLKQLSGKVFMFYWQYKTKF